MSSSSDSSTDAPSFSSLVVPASSAVLVCDDDRDTRSLVSYSIEALGHRVVQAEDGEEARTCCRNELPDLIVIDIMMPRMTGTEFVRWFRGETTPRYVPVLFLTALTEVESRVEGLMLGADDYLTKPFHSRELQARVQALLRIKGLMETLSQRSSALEEMNLELKRAQESLLQKERELVTAYLAGAAAHSLGQPITSILLHCHLLEREAQTDAAKEATAGIRKECDVAKGILSRLAAVDPERTQEYLGNLRILEIPKKA